MCWQPCLHEAVGKVDLIEMDLEGDEEESIPKHGIRIALPNHHVVCYSLCEEGEAVHRMEHHAKHDWKQRANKSTKQKLLDRPEAGLLTG